MLLAVYLEARLGKPLERLLAYSRVALSPGQRRHIVLPVDPRLLADFDERMHDWTVPAGGYKVVLARSATDPVLSAMVHIDGEALPP